MVRRPDCPAGSPRHGTQGLVWHARGISKSDGNEESGGEYGGGQRHAHERELRQRGIVGARAMAMAPNWKR